MVSALSTIERVIAGYSLSANVPAIKNAPHIAVQSAPILAFLRGEFIIEMDFYGKKLTNFLNADDADSSG
jgi:hypothetical protein